MSAVMQGLKITELSAYIGAAIDNSLEDIVSSRELGEAVVAALDRHLMIKLCRPDADPSLMARFSALFGPVRDGGGKCAGGVKGMRIVANEVDAQGMPIPGGDTMGHVWHTDYSADPRPPARIVTYTERAASSRPTTEWVNMIKVYEALPQTLRQRIAGLNAIFYSFRNGVHVDKQDVRVPLEQRQKGELRPLVCRYPGAGPNGGRLYLYLPSRHDSLIPGLSETQSRALLDELWDIVEASPYRLTAAPESGSCVIMDNRAVVHNRQGWALTDPRTVWAISCEGDLPVAAGSLQ
jgi:taurine dioxygenase